MTIVKTPLNRTLTVQVVTGYTDLGDMILKSYSYSGINPEATDAAIFATGQAIASVMNDIVNQINCTEKALLAEQV